MVTCQFHEDNIKRIGVIEGTTKVCEAHIDKHNEQIVAIFSNQSESKKLLTDMKICIERLGITVTTGFRDQKERMDDICKEFGELKDNQNLFKEKIDEFDKFSWFRNTVNKVKDNIFWYFLFFIILIVFLLIQKNTDILNVFKIERVIGG